MSHHSIDEIIDWEWSYWQIYEDHKLPSVVTRDLEHDSSRALDSELGHQIRNDFLSHESRLVGSSLAIRDLSGPTHDLSLLSRESPVTSGEHASRDLWLRKLYLIGWANLRITNR